MESPKETAVSNWDRARSSLSWIAMSALLTAVPAASQPSPPAKPPPAEETPALPRQPGPPQPGDDAVQKPEDLTDKLKRNKGVIRPPAGIDPDIEKPAPVPDPGTTRIIPPPVSPGGEPPAPRR
jgi:hypothetical protein